MKRDLQHLQREKIRITSHLLLQSSLNKYRENCENSTIRELQKEAHHPTKKLAHHIICGKGRFDARSILLARLNLHLNGIGINDPRNGTWLINFLKNKDQDWATPDAPPHRKLHKKSYESWIGETLGKEREMNKVRFSEKLHNIKMKIKTGNIPGYVLAHTSENCKGI